VAGAANNLEPDKRIKASTVPKITPPMVAMMVSCTLNNKPPKTNLRRTSRSK
jgi:hypothetical protein